MPPRGLGMGSDTQTEFFEPGGAHEALDIG
jgi:hypothetical protein